MSEIIIAVVPPDEGPPENRVSETPVVAVVSTETPNEDTQAAHLIRLTRQAALFHTPGGDTYASVPVKAHRETYWVDGTDFERWLQQEFYRATHKTPTDHALKSAVGVVMGKARYEGAATEVHLRVAEHGGHIYLDLGNPNWEVVRVSATGPFEVVHDSTVKFRRPKGMLALPTPEHGGSIEDLRPFVNVRDEHQWKLLVGFILSSLRPRGPYPVLEINGGQGSAKSTMTRVIRELTDPNAALMRSLTQEHDLVIAGEQRLVVGVR